MIQDIVLVVIGLVGLVLGGDFLVRGASRLASSFGVSALVIGLTIVAFGTSAPELLVNVSAALKGNNGLALGNVLGSNIANIGLILGISGLIVPIGVKAILIRREIPFLISVSVLMFVLSLNGTIGRVDGIILVIGAIAFNAFFFIEAKRDGDELRKEADEFSDAVSHTHEDINRMFDLLRIIAGIALLAGGAQAMIEGATNIAREVGVSDLVIGITLVAFGTSLPELAASVTAAMRNQADILVGNVIGSNIYNILVVMGATSAIKPVPVPDSALGVEFPVMLLYTVLLLPFALNRVLTRREGVFLFGSYVAFTIFIITR